MIDHLLGRPSPAYKRSQVIVLLSFWAWRLAYGDSQGPQILKRIPLLRRWIKNATPWQTTVSVLMALYAFRNADKLLGIATPDPLASMYSPSFYRATWITTAFQAGALTAMPFRPNWVRHVLGVVFALYYLIYANEADEKVRKIRAVATVEQLKAGWEMTLNPIIRYFTRSERPRLPIRKKIEIQRPIRSRYTDPIEAYVYSALSIEELERSPTSHEVILDFPGGGFVSMDPRLHEERLIAWAIKTKRLVVSLNYKKAPEYPFPWAIDESFDAYRSLLESRGAGIFLSGKRDLSIIFSGDSAGGNIACCVVFMALQSTLPIRLPEAVILVYPALDFNITSWMKPYHQHLLRSESQSGLHSLRPQIRRQESADSSLRRHPSLANMSAILSSRDHLSHHTPLATTPIPTYSHTTQSTPDPADDANIGRRKSWGKSFADLGEFFVAASSETIPSTVDAAPHRSLISRIKSLNHQNNGPNGTKSISSDRLTKPPNVIAPSSAMTDEPKALESIGSSDNDGTSGKATWHMRTDNDGRQQLSTRLAMTSRVSFYNDRIIPPSLMRSMAILYLGPSNKPDFDTDYFLSPILAPEALLSSFPRVVLCCGEKDPFVDDTIIFAARVRDSKARARTSQRHQTHSSAQNDQDDVDVRILEGMSHGFLQMTSILRDARLTIDMLGDCISNAFEHSGRSRKRQIDGDEEVPTLMRPSEAGYDPHGDSMQGPTKEMRGVRYLDERDLLQRRRDGVMRDMGSVSGSGIATPQG